MKVVIIGGGIAGLTLGKLMLLKNMDVVVCERNIGTNLLGHAFLMHTDGLNIATVDLERYDLLWQSKKNPKLGLSVVTGLGVGPVIPRSDVHFFGVGANHPWNLSGYGGLAKVGFNFDILRWLFFRTDLKIGYISLSKIPTTGRNIDVAKQNIVFYENSWLLGFKF